MAQDYTGDATSTSSTGLLSQAGDKASQVTDQVKDKVAPLVDQAQQKTGAIAGLD